MDDNRFKEHWADMALIGMAMAFVGGAAGFFAHGLLGALVGLAAGFVVGVGVSVVLVAAYSQTVTPSGSVEVEK